MPTAIPENPYTLILKGLLIISTPDKHYYSDKRQYKNPFHKKELFKGQFISLINHNFKNAAFFQQSYLNSSLLIPLSENKNITVFKGNYHVIEEQSYEPYYLLSVASDYEIPDLGISVFCSDQTIGQALQKKEMDIKSTYSYRIGHFLLFPFKIIRSFFRNKKAL